jgi:AraC-like DNA-binding protein
MNNHKSELLHVIEGYRAAARILPESSADAASYFGALRPTIDSALRCLQRLAQAVTVRSSSDLERFRQVLGQARRFLDKALADVHEHPLVCIYDLLRGAKNLLQDLIHGRLVDAERLLSFDRSEVAAIRALLKFPPRKGSRLREVLYSA